MCCWDSGIGKVNGLALSFTPETHLPQALHAPDAAEVVVCRRSPGVGGGAHGRGGRCAVAARLQQRRLLQRRHSLLMGSKIHLSYLLGEYHVFVLSGCRASLHQMTCSSRYCLTLLRALLPRMPQHS